MFVAIGIIHTILKEKSECMDKNTRKIIIIFILFLLAIPLYVGINYLQTHTQVNNTIESEDYLVTVDKRTLESKLQGKATMQSESDDPSSVLVVYSDQDTLHILDNLVDIYGNIQTSSKWEDFVAQWRTYSLESPNLTISIVKDFSNIDDAYLILYNGEVLFNLTDEE